MLTAVLSLLAAFSPNANAKAKPDYAIVVSRATQADGGWSKVVDELVRKHKGTVILYEGAVTDALPKLREQFPRYVCFVAQPAEATREFVARVHRLTRQFDDDPYPDCFWGIVTGYDAANALRIARQEKPLIVRKVASGTEVALDECEQGVWYSEVKQGRMMRKEKGVDAKDEVAPADTTEALVKTLNEYQADLFVTSGHASERNWQIGYGYRDGQFKCERGVLYGLDTKGNRFPVQSQNPKVYLPIGNCLMGHIDGTDAMALAFLNSAGVDQMIGYTVTTWYGYAGWGCLDYFVEQPGRYTFNQAFLANQVALIYRLQTCFPGAAEAELDGDGNTKARIQISELARKAGLNEMDARGLLNDRDTLAFYGDPAWEARMANGKTGWTQTLKEKSGVWTLEINPKLGAKSFEPVNENGSQRGWRPIMEFLPHRVKDVEVIEGADLNPLITDNFVLVPNPRACSPARKYRVVFRAKLVD
ncbi:MAG: hypothetical protein JWR26_3575 [Pedosphaera sp.]|nr:hypothetical protein [Pedosphaera sp.]